MKEFLLGCNYWASNAGTEMWRNWDEDAIRNDFEILSRNGVKHLRVFPVWRDFQPVSPLFDSCVKIREYRVHEDKIPENKYYLDEAMLGKFERFCDIAEEFHLKLIVGIITGWMSGRLFIPPAVYGKNLYTDPTALMFELKFIEGFVQRMKNKVAICAWDLGNECNCMSEANSYELAEVWTGMISNAIKANDSVRPVISGMHSLSIEGIWRISGQAAYTDILTTHPYPYFVPHCSKDNFASMRTLLHATCETKYYSDISGKPCMVEELGNLGPMMCDDEMAGNFIKLNMFSNWASGANGLLWWCSSDQIMLETPPYCWNMCELELGLLDRNKKEKPTLKEIKKFSEWIKSLDFILPEAREDAVCIVTDGQDQWGVAYMSYLLAKQAKLNLKFAYGTQDIPMSDVYMLPSVNSVRMMPSYQFNELKRRVYEGATLYISNNTSVISEFKELTGVIINDSNTTYDAGEFVLNDKKLIYSRNRIYTISEQTAQVICCDENGIPLITVCEYGKGKVYYVNFPVETMLLDMPNAHKTDLFEIYRVVFAKKIDSHIADSDCKYIGITEHIEDANNAYIVLINYSDKIVDVNLKVKSEYNISKVIRGDIESMAPFETTIIKVSRR
ncbi:MAG: hypothetical protein IJE10_00275 [Clostridia bacterium]|nr:hypothetical protein [Clostridia bacterium]